MDTSGSSVRQQRMLPHLPVNCTPFEILQVHICIRWSSCCSSALSTALSHVQYVHEMQAHTFKKLGLWMGTLASSFSW